MKSFLILLLSTIPASLFGQLEITTSSTPREVTVYLSGARVSATASTTIPPGQSTIVISGVSPGLNQNSIQAKGQGDFILLDVSFRTNHLNNLPKPKKLLLLEDSILTLSEKIEVINARQQVLDAEEKFLLANQQIGGQDNGVSSVELEKIATIYRVRLSEIKLKKIEFGKETREINEVLARVRKQEAEMNGNRSRSTGEIMIHVNSKISQTAKFEIDYITTQAGWAPIYDIRTDGPGEKVKIIQRAQVFQNTGEIWKNVQLTLSTGSPLESSVKPQITPWWLSFGYAQQQRISRQNAPASKSETTGAERYEMLKETDATTLANYTTVHELPLTIEYDINLPYTVYEGNKPATVEITSYDMPAEYVYYAAPRLDKSAFLLARISGWEKLNLLPGNANVYFQDGFVGRSTINTQTTNDTLDISLGRDKNIVVERIRVTDLTEKKDLGTKRKENYVYEIAVRNKRSSSIGIIIEDQIPLTTHEEIEVEALEISGAKLKKESGLLTWRIQLKPGETRKMRFGFSVKFPKDKPVSGL